MPNCTEAPHSAPVAVFPVRQIDEKAVEALRERIRQAIESVEDLKQASRVSSEDLQLHVSM